MADDHKILQFPQIHTLADVSVERVCLAAKDVCETAIVLGYDKEGNFYFASTTGEKETILFLLESFKFQLLSGVWDEA